MSTSKHSVGTGSCLCGDIRWEVSGALREMSHCHCLMCRKAHGTAFVTYALSTPEDFRWLSGEQSIRHFASSTSFTRPFCGRCGSTVADSWDSSGEVVLPIGSLEGDFKERPLYHIFVASAAPWHEITLAEYAIRLCINDHSCVNSAAQYAGLAALTGPQDAVHEMVAAFDERRRIIVAELNQTPRISRKDAAAKMASLLR